MMLAHLGDTDASAKITTAVEQVAGESGTTVEMADKVIAAL